MCSAVASLGDLWKVPVIHGALCCSGTRALACVLPHLQRRQEAWQGDGEAGVALEGAVLCGEELSELLSPPSVLDGG